MKIFKRFGFTDIIIPINEDTIPSEDIESFFVGYELEDGTECEEDGSPL